MSHFADGWDPDAAAQFSAEWVERKYLRGSLIDVEHLVDVVYALLQNRASMSLPSVTVAPRPAAPT